MFAEMEYFELKSAESREKNRQILVSDKIKFFGSNDPFEYSLLESIENSTSIDIINSYLASMN